jgi:hypothetical protein
MYMSSSTIYCQVRCRASALLCRPRSRARLPRPIPPPQALAARQKRPSNNFFVKTQTRSTPCHPLGFSSRRAGQTDSWPVMKTTWKDVSWPPLFIPQPPPNVCFFSPPIRLRLCLRARNSSISSSAGPSASCLHRSVLVSKSAVSEVRFLFCVVFKATRKKKAIRRGYR